MAQRPAKRLGAALFMAAARMRELLLRQLWFLAPCTLDMPICEW
jgi:hypothetical protein